MNFGDVVLMSTANLARRKGRTFLTLTGVVIGIAALVLMISLALGLKLEVMKLFQSEDALRTLMVMRTKTSSGKNGKPVNPMNFGFGGIPISEREIEELRKLPGVHSVTPDLNLFLNMEIEGDKEDPIMVPIGGLLPVDEAAMRPYLCAGTVWKDPTERALLIPSRMLSVRFSKKPQDVVGKKAILSIAYASEDEPQPKEEEMTFTIVGVIETEKLGFRASQMYLPMERALELRELTKGGSFAFMIYKKGHYTTAEVKAADVKAVTEVKKLLTNSGYQVLSTADIIGTINTFFLVLEVFMGSIGAIGLLVSLFGIANTMLTAVIERTREIGIMKAVGARNSHVRGVFLLEAAGIGLLGGLIGLPVGAIVGTAVNFVAHHFRAIPDDMHVFHIPWWLIAGTLVFSVAVSTIAGFVPALRASRMDPVQALRYE